MRLLGIALASGLAVGLVACASGTPPPATGFLGSYLGLEALEEEPSEIFIDPQADFSRYDAIVLEPVTVWLGEEATWRAAPRSDLKRLADGLDLALRTELAQEFTLVERSDANALRLRAAITDPKGADTRINIVSRASRARMGVPDQPLAGPTRDFLARASIEVEALDSLTNRRLAAAVDPGAAPLALERTPDTWGDVAAAWQAWSDGVQAALAAFRRNAREPEAPATASLETHRTADARSF